MDAVWTYVARHSVAIAISAWLLMLLATPAIASAHHDTPITPWATALVLVTPLYAAGAAWAFERDMTARLAGPHAQRGLAALVSFALTPWITGGALVALGAAPWSIWVALTSSGILLIWRARRLHKISDADGPERRPGTLNGHYDRL